MNTNQKHEHRLRYPYVVGRFNGSRICIRRFFNEGQLHGHRLPRYRMLKLNKAPMHFITMIVRGQCRCRYSLKLVFLAGRMSRMSSGGNQSTKNRFLPERRLLSKTFNFTLLFFINNSNNSNICRTDIIHSRQTLVHCLNIRFANSVFLCQYPSSLFSSPELPGASGIGDDQHPTLLSTTVLTLGDV